MQNRKILIVDDDEVLGRVLGRVLTQQGYGVSLAGTAAEAVQIAEEQKPGLALLDLSLPDGNGTDLGRELRARLPGQVQILMTGYPLRLREHPELATDFAKVFTKPLDLKELRQTVDSLLDPSSQKPAADDHGGHPDGNHALVAEPSGVGQTDFARRLIASRRRRVPVLALLLVLLLVIAGGAAAWFHEKLPALADLWKPKMETAEKVKTPANKVRLADDSAFALIVPDEVVRKLEIQTARADRVTGTRPLSLDGYLAYDPNTTVTVNTLFAGRIETLPEYPDVRASRYSGETVRRPVQYKDQVEKDQVLAILYSKDLGDKKSDLVDAWSEYKLQKENVSQLEELLRKGLTSEASVAAAKRSLEGAVNAVDRARRTLAIWKVSDEDLNELQKEAERLLSLDVSTRVAQSTRQQVGSWAKVEIKAPFAGTIVEKNAAEGAVVDPTKDLYKIARSDYFLVYAHAYESMLPALMALGVDERRWKVRVTDNPNLDFPEGPITTVGSVDPNQHTVPLIGPINNPKDPRTGEAQLVAGQFATATVQVPAAPNEVAIPTTALVEGGRESVVFVQPDLSKPRYELRRVTVLRRTKDLVYTRWVDPHLVAALLGWPGVGARLGQTVAALCSAQVQPDEHVVTNGSLLLLSELEDLRSQQKD